MLFDIDGTLVHTGGAGVKAFAKVFESEFGAKDGFEKLKFAGRTDMSLVREFFGVHGIPATKQNFERFFERYVFWLDHILQDSQTEICPGVWEFIDELNALMIRCMVNTSLQNTTAMAVCSNLDTVRGYRVVYELEANFST